MGVPVGRALCWHVDKIVIDRLDCCRARLEARAWATRDRHKCVGTTGQAEPLTGRLARPAQVSSVILAPRDPGQDQAASGVGPPPPLVQLRRVAQSALTRACEIPTKLKTFSNEKREPTLKTGQLGANCAGPRKR